ncbi:hypothetical protein [Pontibacter arcticus]|uniref:PepSY domain-containing protein n=1 Tax=Pontibacter arcticus TaxID=2080288 RepID=A0A364RJ96_9BACT|nr:hypothetical protein [Pontibacter arcticus]RAU84377.1 hypothetical protein DP923_04885 [Pontibacter arcticus]
MKKLTVIAFAFAAFGLVSTEANAQAATTGASTQAPAATTTTTQTTTTSTTADKQKIEETQLPEAVKTSMKAEAFKDWTVAEIYKVAPDASAAGATTTYEIYFTNAEQKRAIARFDETGKPIRKADNAASTETQQ